MSVLRHVLLAGALITAAFAARRIVTGQELLPIPLGVWLVAVGVCTVGYLGGVYVDRITRHLDQQLHAQEQRREQREVSLLIEGLEVAGPQQTGSPGR